MTLRYKLINVLVLVTLFIGTILVSIAQPTRRGFWCSDETIKYPRQSDTVDGKQLALIVLLIPLTVILFCELLLPKLKQFHGSSRQSSIDLSDDSSIPCRLSQALYTWLFSLFLTALLTGLIKNQAGRLRPVFYHLCAPDISCENPANQGVYLTDYSCSEADTKLEVFIRTSFPSGHSSYTISSMLFLVIYITKRFHVTIDNPLRYFIALFQTLFLSIALFVALSRVSDNIHHWSDVLAGLILGSLVTLIGTLSFGQLDYFPQSTDKSSKSTWKMTANQEEQLETL